MNRPQAAALVLGLGNTPAARHGCRMSDLKPLSKTRLWLLLAAAFGTFSIGAGFMHAYTVFLVTFVEAFGWSRAQVSLAYSVSQMVNGVSSPLVGWLVD